MLGTILVPVITELFTLNRTKKATPLQAWENTLCKYFGKILWENTLGKYFVQILWENTLCSAYSVGKPDKCPASQVRKTYHTFATIFSIVHQQLFGHSSH